MTRLLIITDSSSGAGLSRDIAIAAAIGLQVMPVLTAVTVQTDRAPHLVHHLPPTIIADQIAAAVETARPAAVKVSMPGSAEAAKAVAVSAYVPLASSQIGLNPIKTLQVSKQGFGFAKWFEGRTEPLR